MGSERQRRFSLLAREKHKLCPFSSSVPLNLQGNFYFRAYHALDFFRNAHIILIMTLLSTHAKRHLSIKKPIPKNKIQEWAFKKYLYTPTQFANSMSDNGIMSYGAAHALWHSGRARGAKMGVLLSVVKFFGAEKIEDVFDP